MCAKFLYWHLITSHVMFPITTLFCMCTTAEVYNYSALTAKQNF